MISLHHLHNCSPYPSVFIIHYTPTKLTQRVWHQNHTAKRRHHLDSRESRGIVTGGRDFSEGWGWLANGGGIRWAVCSRVVSKGLTFSWKLMVVKSQPVLGSDFWWAFQMIAWCLFQDPCYWNHFKRCLVAQLAVADREKKGILGLQVPKSSFGMVPCRHFIQFSYATSSKGAIAPSWLVNTAKRACLKIKDDLIQCFTVFKSTISMDVWDIPTYPNARVKSSYGLLRQNLLNNSSTTLDSPL